MCGFVTDFISDVVETVVDVVEDVVDFVEDVVVGVVDVVVDVVDELGSTPTRSARVYGRIRGTTSKRYFSQ